MSISPVGPVGVPAVYPAIAEPQSPGTASGPFARLLHDALSQANAQEAQANQAVQDLAGGRSNDVHGVVLAVAKADLTFRLLLEIRNRLTDAFQEILRMQV